MNHATAVAAENQHLRRMLAELSGRYSISLENERKLINITETLLLPNHPATIKKRKFCETAVHLDELPPTPPQQPLAALLENV